MKHVLSILTTLLCTYHGQASTRLPLDSSQYVKIILIRHAERANNDTDAALSQSGLDRAGRLVSVLKDIKIDELYATPFKRTRGTVEPIAQKNNQQIFEYKTNEMKTLAETLRKKWGKTILIAGHANTTPNLTNLLIKEEKYREIEESDFGKIFIVTIHKSGVADVLVLNY